MRSLVGACDTTASKDTVYAWSHALYDNKPLGELGALGDTTSTEAVVDYTTTYTPATGTLPTTVAATGPTGWTSSTTYAGARNLPVKVGGKVVQRVCGGTHSFVPGTGVLMADGTRKPIEEVAPGDVVLATDPETGETKPRTVLASITTEDDKDFVDLTVETDEGDASIIATTNHPFWSPDLEQWINAGDLKPGQWLQTSTGTRVRIGATRHFREQQRTNDLTVDDVHTYYVLAADTPVLVHNVCGPVTNSKPNDLPFEMLEAEYRSSSSSPWHHRSGREVMAIEQDDFLAFRSLDSGERGEWLRGRFPDGTPAHWWFFVVDSVGSELGRFSRAAPDERARALRFGLDAARFAVDTGDLSTASGVMLTARLLERAALIGELVDLVSGEVDGVFAWALDAIPLSPEAALAAAERRREEARTLEASVHRAGAPQARDELPEDREIGHLVELEEMLRALGPLAALILDRGLRARAEIWFAIEERFDLGDAASAAVIRRWNEGGRSRTESQGDSSTQ
ncbi:polymorphic toxin-type HINT domain-containing protein [Embleya sp. MST-111070]|uniref:polymorphic toxin-type HINT domain-containing protein n=1 Tax=Embleya sp. MST-111070 TaxID=3398231 RepID=UPI003F732102